MNVETVASRIHRKLTVAFAPTRLEIKDESAKHIGHAGHRPGEETHFHVTIAAPSFEGLSRVACHRAVYDALADEIKESGIHALALDVSAR